MIGQWVHNRAQHQTMECKGSPSRLYMETCLTLGPLKMAARYISKGQCSSNNMNPLKYKVKTELPNGM